MNNLAAEEPVLRWEAVCTLGNLALIDKKRTVAHIDQLAFFLNDKSIVLQGHAVRALSKIAEAFPDEAPRILDKLLKARKQFPGNHIGFIIEAMEHLLVYEDLKHKIKRFVESFATSDIKVIAIKSKKVLKKI